VYSTVLFDCDGVILNSNKLKAQAFYNAGLLCGECSAEKLSEYHKSNGGISRYEKFEWFLQNIVGEGTSVTKEQLLKVYAKEVRDGLMSCGIAQGLQELRELTSGAKWLVVSGGDQSELRDIFAARGIANLFDGGIFGSPDNKHEIIARETASGNIKAKSLFIGDSENDYVAANKATMDFVFLYGWSELENWKDFCNSRGVIYRKYLDELLNSEMNFSSLKNG
jgi:phosphoglycolate phosphatase-like HAD superfamily hydrolase